MGPGHCGSTLLDLILGSHSKAFSLGEFRMIGKTLERHNGRKLCGICDDHCDFWNDKVGLHILKSFYSRKNTIDQIISKICRLVLNPYFFIFFWFNKNVIIDSSKKPSWFKKQLTPAYTYFDVEPFLIYMVRDGRAVVNSYLRKYPEKGFVQIMDMWKSQILSMNQYYKGFPESKKITVKYEELATNPEKIVKSICNRLKIKFERQMLHYWKHEHHVIYGNLGTRSLIMKYNRKSHSESKNWSIKQITNEKQVKKNYYEDLGLSIKLDLRWRHELSEEHIKMFSDLAEDLNEPFIYNEKR
jgi:hypothetical protein